MTKAKKTNRGDGGSSKPKLSVFADRDLLKTIRREKAETDLTIEEIVNTRLRMSYESHPGPLRTAN